jgi:hypothetical protein
MTESELRTQCFEAQQVEREKRKKCGSKFRTPEGGC